MHQTQVYMCTLWYVPRYWIEKCQNFKSPSTDERTSQTYKYLLIILYLCKISGHWIKLIQTDYLRNHSLSTRLIYMMDIVVIFL